MSLKLDGKKLSLEIEERFNNINDRGFPTSKLLPITTIFLPSIVIFWDLNKLIIPAGVHDLIAGSFFTNLPMFISFNPSTSLLGLI